MKIAFFFCTRSPHAEDTLAYKSLIKIKDNTLQKFDIHYSANNREGLSKSYNQKMLEKNIEKYDYIVFLHDDVYVDDYNICNKLIKAHESYDIVGLAGGINPQIKKPALWHLMCGGFGPNLRGAVAHYANETQLFMTNFGPTPSRVTILDGLFISVSTDSVIKTGWKFNEDYSFHHYDIASSLDANEKKLKLGVFPIWVVHKSPGLLNINDNTFTQSQEKFIRKYANL
ncbi:hypothetical protein EBR43_10460 [bacterium]|nr:hypothetical protein [bacterium]